MYADNKALQGDKCALRFGLEFPIRFDFLDTFNGDNLSIQCHAGAEYLSRYFGETLPQDESYYILDAKDDSCVYLGFQEGVSEATFREKLEASFLIGQSVSIEEFVQRHVSQRHDYFTIPHGTVHGAGKNNLVLEISSTPYIFTFKMYDWLRVDLDGEPRTLNIEVGLNF